MKDFNISKCKVLTISKVEETEEVKEPKVSKSEGSSDKLIDKLLKSVADTAAKSFFEETIGTEVSTEKLSSDLLPFLEKAVYKAFKGKQGLKNFLHNVGYIKE
jgi:hypothetical protein